MEMRVSADGGFNNPGCKLFDRLRSFRSRALQRWVRFLANFFHHFVTVIRTGAKVNFRYWVWSRADSTRSAEFIPPSSSQDWGSGINSALRTLRSWLSRIGPARRGAHLDSTTIWRLESVRYLAQPFQAAG